MLIVYYFIQKPLQEYYCGQTSDLAQRLVRYNCGETRSIVPTDVVPIALETK
jgi:predicted GIY-YIG superfamily endonuclease